MTAIEIVTADGRLRRVDADHDPDIFWALRGGNGNVGVVTGLDFRVHPVAELCAGNLFFPAERTEEVLRTWAAMLPDLPEELMTWFTLLHAPDLPFVPPGDARRLVRGGARRAPGRGGRGAADPDDAMLGNHRIPPA